MGSRNNLIGVVDIGSTKICAMICKPVDNGVPIVIGFGESPSEGLDRGMLVNTEQAVNSIRAAVILAEESADSDLPPAFVGISGEHVKSVNSRGVIVLPSSRAEITRSDRNKVKETARAIAMPPNQEILHVLPQEYIVDDRRGITEPVGLSGSRLEAEVHIVTISTPSSNDLRNCLKSAGVHVRKLVLEPLASSYSVLQKDERRMGVVLVDIGGGTTDVAVFFGGSIRHSAVVPLGGNHITNDLAAGLTTPIMEAELLKIRHGNTFPAELKSGEVVEVPGFGRDENRPLAIQVLGSIIEPRVEEIFSLVRLELNRTDASRYIGAGMVVTGGGSLLGGLRNYLEEMFGMRVRIGYPAGYMFKDEEIVNPKYATCTGLVDFALSSNGAVSTNGVKPKGRVRGMLRYAGDVIKELLLLGEGG